MTSMLFLNIPLIFISVIGILFNGYIVTAVLLTRQVTTANNLLLLHLGTIDLILGLLFLIFSAPNNYTKNLWLSDDFGCILHGFLHNLLHPLALWTICGLNCDRYYAIAAPLHYSHIVNTKKVLTGLGIGYIIAFVLCLPPFFQLAPFHYSAAFSACIPNFENGAIWYSSLYTAFTLLLPTTIIICSNIKILMIARYQRHRIASAIYEVTLSAQVTITHQRNPFIPIVTAPNAPPPKFHGRGAIYSILQLVGSVTILYFPYYVITLWESSNLLFPQKIEKLPLNHFHTVSAHLLILSPTINGFLYGVKSKQLRKTFKNYWRKKQTKSEVNQEIQARTPSTCGSRRPSLTPLGFLVRPNLQRRLSEAFLDRNGIGNAQKNKIKRITTDITQWRPSSANSLNFLNKIDEKRMGIKQTTSCNTLQVPNSICDEIKEVKEVNKMSPNSFLLKFFGEESHQKKKHQTITDIVEENAKRCSPRITITRTCSEEKLKQVTPSSTHSSDSLNGSDESGKIFMALDAKLDEDEDDDDDDEDEDDVNENDLLLTWSRLEQIHIYDGIDEKEKESQITNDTVESHKLANSSSSLKQQEKQSQDV